MLLRSFSVRVVPAPDFSTLTEKRILKKRIDHKTQLGGGFEFLSREVEVVSSTRVQNLKIKNQL